MTQTYNCIVPKGALYHLANWNKWLSWVVSTYIRGVFDRMLSSCQVRISEGIHTVCLPEYQPVPVRNKSDIMSLSDSKETRTQSHFLRKRTSNHFVKLPKWLSWFVSNYIYGAFGCMLSWCHVRISEWSYTLYFPQCQRVPCAKESP